MPITANSSIDNSSIDPIRNWDEFHNNLNTSHTTSKSINNNEDIYTSESGLVFNPFNEKNKEITEQDIINILKKHGISAKPNNLALYQRAFIHRSYTKRPDSENKESGIILSDKPDNCISLKTKSNERLEFLGDGVLELITKYYLYRRFPKQDEGFMTEKKIAIVKNEHIGKLALEIGLHEWFVISRTTEEKNTRTNLKKLGCLFEAFLGALFLDFNKITIYDEHKWFNNVFVCGPGFQMAQIFVENIFENYIDWPKLIKTDDNYKNILQVQLQRTFKCTPDYIELNRTIESGYTMGVYLCVGKSIHSLKPTDARDLNTYDSFSIVVDQYTKSQDIFIKLSEATHKVKKKAEQIACEHAIHKINNM